MTKQQQITFVIPVALEHLKYEPKLLRGVLAAGYPCNIQVDTERIGKCAMLNRMILNVETKWIRFLDADDIPVFTYHEEDYDFDSYDLIYTDCMERYAEGVEDYFRAGELDYLKFLRANYIPFSTVIVRTEIAREIKFERPEYVPWGEDWLWLSKVADRRVLYIPDVSCIRRNYTSTYDWRGLKGKLRKVRKQIKDTLGDLNHDV